MHKEPVAQDENSNPREGQGSRRKDRLSPGEHDMNHINRSRPKTGSWDSNGFGPEIETLAGRTEESVPLSPSNSLNLRHLRGCEKDFSGRQHHRSPSNHYHPNYYSSHHHHRTSYTSQRKGYWDYENQYRDGKRKAWVPRPGGGHHMQRPRNREPYNSTEGLCGDPRPEQTSGEKSKTYQGVSRQPSPSTEKEQNTEKWLLFKPLPVFPVDNSSARTSPKISYASKVKENLDGKGLVPSSALRTSNTPPSCVLNATQSGLRSDSSSPAPAQSTSSLSSSSCSSLSSTPPSPVNQENLGAIFQNEWGLSFINEPGAGQAPEEPKEEETGGGIGVEGGGGDDGPPPSILMRLSTGFFVESVEAEEAPLENPKDWETMVNFSLHEWNKVWSLHKRDPSRVVVYAESMDGKG